MPENLYLLLSFSISFAVVSFAVPKIIAVAHAKKLFDIPTHRSASKNNIIPNLGGIAIFAGIYISVIISLEGFDYNKIAGLALVSFLMFLMGLKDDMIGLSAGKKITGQLFVSLYLIVLCNFRFTNLHGIFGLNEISYGLSLFVTLVIIIGLINAFNLIDGIDGLASGIGTVISATYGFIFMYFGQLEFSIVSFSITGALVSFFFYNVFGTENKIFMGDTGSLTLGVLFAVLTIWYNELIPTHGISNLLWSSPAISLSIMIVPVIDSIRVFYIRISQGRSPFSPDMNHIHHHLIQITKNNHLHATLILILANILLIFLSFGLINLVGNAILFAIILGAGLLMSHIPVMITRNMKSEPETKQKKPDEDGTALHVVKSDNRNSLNEPQKSAGMS